MQGWVGKDRTRHAGAGQGSGSGASQGSKGGSAKARFNGRFPELNLDFYTALTKRILSELYPKYCPGCKTLLDRDISTRETAVRCGDCNYQGSRTAYTPLHHLKIPLWTFSYVLMEALQRFPLGLSGLEIQRRLGVSKATATLLKRRLQLFLSEMLPAVKTLLRKDIEQAWGKEERLPEQGNLKDFVKDRPVVHTDCLALFSATQRANAGRSRYKHTGQTASIYLSDRVAEERGKYQVGTLCSTLAVKKGPVLLSSVPDQKQKTLQPLFDFLPPHTPLFADEGTPWFTRYNSNFRAVNHTARAKNRKRSVWAKNRWSRDGVSNNTAEGTQRIVKHSFIASYSYFAPENSTLYLNEFSALKALRVYGLRRISCETHATLGNLVTRHSPSPSGGHQSRRDGYLFQKLREYRYNPPSWRDRGHLDHRDSRRRILTRYRVLLDDNEYFLARQAHIDYLNFWDDAPLYQKQAENRFNAVAHELWKSLPRYDEALISRLADRMNQPHRLLLRMVRKWAAMRLVKVIEVKHHRHRVLHYRARRLVSVLPDFLYSMDLDEFCSQSPEHEQVEIHRPAPAVTSKYAMNKQQRKQYLQEMSDATQ